MRTEIWFALGGWDLEREEPVAGGVLMESCRTLAQGLDHIHDHEVRAPLEHGPGDLVILANDGERLSEPVPCPVISH